MSLLVGLSAGWFAGCGTAVSDSAATNSFDSPFAAMATNTGNHPWSDKLVTTGSSTIAPLAAELAKEFERRHPQVRIDVQTGGSSRGIADVQSGIAQIGMVSRALKGDEQKLVVHPIAIDGVCLIVHRDNLVTELSDEQIVAIYTGAIRNWRQVGGHDAEIVVVHKAEGRATLEVFLAYFQLDNARVRPSLLAGENQQVIKTVAGNPLAIGYVSIGTADVEVRGGTAIRMLPANGVEPTAENVAMGRFPLTRPLLLITREPPTGLTRAFLEFAQSPQVQDLIEAQNFVPISR